MNEIIAKLNATYNLAIRIKNTYPSTIPREEVDKLYARYLWSVEKANDLMPDLFEGHESCKIDEHLIAEHTRYNKIVLEKLSNEINYYLDILNGISDLVSTNCKVTNEGVFFAGQTFDALMKIGEIIETANNEIILLDSYLNDKILHYIKSKNTRAILNIITSKKTMKEDLKYSIDLATIQYGKLTIYYDESFHDRFLIIDKKYIYHFGASFKDAGKKGFMFSLIQEETINSALLNKIAKIIS